MGGANYWIGDSHGPGKTLFDDKVAVTDVMKYPDGNAERKLGQVHQELPDLQGR